jgi:predicted secreted protein
MINEERVILMTKLASYERGPGKKNVTISNFFRSDYIGFQLLKSVIYATMASAIVVGVYICFIILKI